MTLQVRRGSDRAEVYSIALSPNVQWLAVSSDKGTVHIFSLRVRVIGEDVLNHSSIDQGPEMAHQNSSTSLDALISPNTGANPSSSLSFMKGKKHHSLSTSLLIICSTNGNRKLVIKDHGTRIYLEFPTFITHLIECK